MAGILLLLLSACGGGSGGSYGGGTGSGSNGGSGGGSGSGSGGGNNGGSAPSSVWISDYTQGSNADISGVTEVTPAAIAAGSCTPTTCVTFTGGGMNNPGVVTSDVDALTLDANGNVWVVVNNPNSAGGATEVTATAISNGACSTSTCLSYTGGGIYDPQGIAADSAGDVWIADGCNPTTGCSAGNGGVTEIKPGAAQDCSSGCAYFTIGQSNGYPLILPKGVAVDGQGNVWFTSDGCVSGSSCTPNSAGVVEITAADVQAGACNQCVIYSNNNTATGNIAEPAGVAADSLGNIWVANGCGPANCFDYFGGSVTEIRKGAATDCTSGCIDFAESGIFQPAGVAVDNSGNIWVTDPTLPGVTEITSAAATAGACGTSSCVNFNTGDSTGSLAIDTSNDVWVVRSTDNSLLEILPGASADCSSGCIRMSLPFTPLDVAVKK